MDKRIAKTRTAIFDAFYLLLSQKRYGKISIQDIITVANISRSTFYTHFATKDDLLKEMCQDLFSHIFCLKPAAETSHDFSSVYGRIDLLIIHILYHLKDDEKKLKAILRCESCDLFWDYMKQQFYLLVTSSMLNTSSKIACPVPDSLLANHICISFIELCKWWIKNGMVQSPEVIEQYFELLLFSLENPIHSSNLKSSAT